MTHSSRILVISIALLALGVANPAISASYGIFASLLFGAVGLLLTRGDQPVHGADAQ